MIRVVKTIESRLEKKVCEIGKFETIEDAEEKISNEAVSVDIPRMIGVRAGMPTSAENDMIRYFYKKAFRMKNGYAKVGNDDETVYYVCLVERQ